MVSEWQWRVSLPLCTFLLLLHIDALRSVEGIVEKAAGDGVKKSAPQEKVSYASAPHSVPPAVNLRPIIGIVTERLYAPSPDGSNHLDTKSSFIAASYVKWIESGGARVVPILMNKHEDYYEKMFHSVNGVLFPGGAVSLNHSGYAHAGRILLKLAIKEALSGGYFPVWGTCLGFELINEIMASDPKIISKCSAENMSLSLDLSPDYKSSRPVAAPGMDCCRRTLFSVSWEYRLNGYEGALGASSCNANVIAPRAPSEPRSQYSHETENKVRRQQSIPGAAAALGYSEALRLKSFKSCTDGI